MRCGFRESARTRQHVYVIMEPMKRTTIFLPEELHENLRQEAFRARVSMAELIRSKLQTQPRARSPKADPLLELAGLGSDGRLTAAIDEELYGI